MRILTIAILSLLLAVPAHATVHAGSDLPGLHIGEPESGDRAAQRGDGKTLAQAIEQVRRQYDVQRIVEAKTRRSGNREVHRIKFMTKDGTVKTVSVQGRRID